MEDIATENCISATESLNRVQRGRAKTIERTYEEPDVKFRKSLLPTCEIFLKIQDVGVEDMVEKIVSALKRYACILFDGYKTY